MSDPVLWQIALEADEATAHAVADRLGFLSETTGEALSIAITYPGESPRVEAIYAEREAAERAAREIGASVERLAPRDWVSDTQAGLPPVRAGRFLLYGSHEDPDVAEGAPVPIRMDAGLAFGTGHHGTTEGCLHLFDTRLEDGADYSRVLDIGTGSGVLAIAAARTLSGAIHATDIDPDAVEVTRANALENGVGDRVEVWRADGLEDARFGTYDLVFANILARPLMGMAGDIVRVADGEVILSGILDTQADEVSEAFRAHGLSEVERLEIGEWVSLLMRK